MDLNKRIQLLIRQHLLKEILKNMVMDSGSDSYIIIQLDYQMERINHGISLPDWLIKRNMITLEWEIECWLFGKDKDIIISLHATKLITIQITSRTSTIQKILKDYGHIFTIHIVMIRIEQLVISNTEMMIYNQLNMMLTILKLNM